MSKNEQATNELLDNLDVDEVVTLADLVGGLNPVDVEDGSPKYTADEMNLIGRFKALANDDDDESDSDDSEPESDDEEITAETDFQTNSFAPES